MKLPNVDYRLLIVVLLCASCSPKEPAGVVARIGGRVITVDDLQAEAQRRRQRGRPVPAKEELLHEMLSHEAQLWRAKEAGLTEDPKLKREIERLLVMRLRERELAEKLKAVEVPEDAVRAEYERRIAEYTRPALDRFAVLFLQLDPHASDEKRAAVRARLEEGRRSVEPHGFGKAAIRCSDDQLSRYRGGDLGWVAENKTTARLPKEVLEIGRGLEKGALSEIIEAGDGLYLLLKTDMRPAVVTPFEKVRGGLEKRLLAARRKAVERGFVDSCLQAAAPEIDEAMLADAVLQEKPVRTESPALGGLPVAEH